MAEVTVKSIAALQTLRTGLVRYAADAPEYMAQMERELRRTQAWLIERERHWMCEVEHWRRELAQAQTALHRCIETIESWNRDRSYGVDCSEQRLRVNHAADQLDKVAKALANVRHHIKQVNEAGATFTSYMRRLSGILQKELPQATELLNRSVSQLESYVNTQAPATSTIGIALTTDNIPIYPDTAITAGSMNSVSTNNSVSAIDTDCNHSDQSLRFGELSPNAGNSSTGDPNELDPNRIPKGFENVEQFNRFGTKLNEGLAKAGYKDTQAAFQGSSVTGMKHETGAPFDVGRTSDFDIALAGEKLMRAAQDIGVQLRGHGIRTEPLSAGQLRQLGLRDLANELKELAGRPVAFMIYRSIEGVVNRAPSILVPK